MNEDTKSPVSAIRRWSSLILGLVLGLLAAGLAVLLAIGVLAVFNGCTRSPGPFMDLLSMGWLFILWPTAAVGAAVVPAVLIARGRSWLRAVLTFAAGAVLAFGVYILGIVLMYAVHC